MNNEKLEQFILDHVIPGYGIKLLKLEDAIKFVMLCKEEDAKLGGFDGFYLHPNGGVQIEQLLSPDYSRNTKEESYELALEFFAEQKDENVGYEMVYKKY